MSFTKSFREKVRTVRLRCSLNLLLRQAGLVLAFAGTVAILAILVERLLAVSVRLPATLWAFGGAAVLFTLVPWLLRMPSRMQASLLLDERLKLSERFSTTLALAESEDPFAQAARAESLRVVQGANLKGHFPIALSRRWFYGAGTWLVAIGLLLYLPQRDLLGFLRQHQDAEQQAKQLEEAKADVTETTEAVKAAVQQLGDPNLAEDLRKLDELAQAADPQNVKREAIKALGSLSEKIEQMQSSGQADAANMLKQTLKQLRGSSDPFSRQMRQALAKGDFGQAANMLRQMQQELAEGKVPSERSKELAEQLQQLAAELQKLAAEREQLEQELEKLGLDKKLAQMNSNQMRQALQQQGVNPEMVEQLMQKMAACQMAQGKCSALGQAMAAAGGSAGGLSADELSEAVDQLDALESLQQQMTSMRASLAEIYRSLDCLGEGMCNGLGGQGPWREGVPRRMGSGTGGPGLGYGGRDSDTEGQTGTKTTRAQSQSNDGQVIASWYFKDNQVKGESRRSFSDVVQAGRDSAAEAISENEIPRKYENAVKQYFNQLEDSGPRE
ncbi:MAG: hypothetical protein JW993_17115 [Sedimentisphaerales bacterium]|nr:hypothetical protein [Sedimentisphaerales bacterium]